MLFETNYFSHHRAMQQCLQELGARAHIDFASLRLLVSCRGREIELLPQFLFRRDTGIAYTSELSTEVRGFIGWRHYFNRIWLPALDKLLFKQFCAANGLLTPRHDLQATADERAVIIKQSRSSFGHGIKGPVRLATLAASNHQLARGEFYEEFIQGEIAKIWYWNESPVALEVLSMPSVVGDGRATLRKLIESTRTFYTMHGHVTLDIAQSLAQWQGMTLDSVVPAGRSVLTDFRYQSLLHPVKGKQNELEAYAGRDSLRQIKAAGRPFWLAIPEHIRPNTLFSVDAIIDAQDKVWFLEMNCNPMVHVDAYRPMLVSLLADESPQLEASPPQAAVPALRA